MSTPDISSLSSRQQEALQTYTSVTDQDPLAAIPILQRAEWNVQIAIARFFDGEPTTDPVAEARAAIPAPSARQTSNLQYDSLFSIPQPRPPPDDSDRVERIDASATNTTYQQPSLILSLLFTPLNILYRVFSAILPSFVTRFFSRLLPTSTQPQRRALPPQDNARRFIREFNETYLPSTASSTPPLPFTESGFNHTLTTCSQNLTYLLVTLLSPSHDDNHTFVTNTLLSPTFTTFLSHHASTLTLWGGSVQDNEGYLVSTSLSCTKFPFVALIAYQPSTTTTSSPGMTVLTRSVGPTTPSELVTKLSAAITAHDSQLVALRSQRAEQQASRNLRQEQDSAYERSLTQDRERARQKKEEAEASARAEKDAIAATEARELLQRRKEQWRRWRASSIPTEPGTEVKETVRLSLRMQAGERVVRKFKADAGIEELYAFVECYDVLQRDDEAVREKDVEEPEGYEHKYGFRLVSPMPRTVVEVKDRVTIGERLGRSGNLIVEDLDQEEEGGN